jgi:voltage-gated potassium channel
MRDHARQRRRRRGRHGRSSLRRVVVAGRAPRRSKLAAHQAPSLPVVPPSAPPSIASADTLPGERAGHTWEAREFGIPASGWRRRWFIIIFEADTRAGRRFDVWLLIAILTSVIVVMLDSVQSVGPRHRTLFDALEWGFTLAFTVEYVLRLAIVERPMRYARSFFGVVDLLAVVPTYLAFFFPDLHALIDVRVLRLLRTFRILKLVAYVSEYRYLAAALHDSRRKILVFLAGVLMIQVTLSTLMYVIEGPENGFTSIPTSVYWGITAMTTVGFGDIVPRTDLGRAIASVMMLLGWGILAVPTGIVTAEMTRRSMGGGSRRCAACGNASHLPSARYCQACGEGLPAGDEG